MRKSYTKSPKKVVYKKQRPELVMAKYMTPMRSLPEAKTVDNAITMLSGTNSGFSTPLVLNQTAITSVSNGLLAVDARIGRKIFMTSLSMKLLVPSVPGRIIVVYDRQANGTIPLVGTYLKSDNVASLTNLVNKERFVVLMDEWYPKPNDNGYAVGGVIPVSYYRKINLEALYQDATIGNNVVPTTGSILIAYANTGATAVAVTGNTRVRFTDP